MNTNIGLLGCGTVGSGVVELVGRRMDKIADLTGLRPVIKTVLVRDMHKPRPVDLGSAWLTTRPDDILKDSSISVVIETIGGVDSAREFVLAALNAGKHVITANKDLMAAHGDEIYATANAAGAMVMYEAAVGGAIPVIRPLLESLTANEITSLKGIINGTSNYILSKMTETGANFADVLREAQELGYAEQDPSSDIDGWDAARKLVILASLAFHSHVRLADVEVRGIRDITAADVAYARDLGMVIKLLAEGEERNSSLVLQVHPCLVHKEHPLAHVSDANNALYVHGDAAGDLMFYGRGAGSLPTASAIVGDLIDVLRSMQLGVNRAAPLLRSAAKPVNLEEAAPRSHYIRLVAADEPGVFAEVAGIFGRLGVSMESVLQRRAHQGMAEIVIVTHKVAPVQLRRVVEALGASAHVHRVCCIMPVEL